jgi:hypothetical protein
MIVVNSYYYNRCMGECPLLGGDKSNFFEPLTFGVFALNSSFRTRRLKVNLGVWEWMLWSLRIR